MANIKSAIKRVDTNRKKHDLNQNYKSDMRTHIKRVEKLVAANDVEGAKKELVSTTRKIDKAVGKGVIHSNTGNRQKSRLAKLVQNA
ncbi:30S ribosomal protein S20 [Lentibacillus sp. JNUCC-1]|uniref:30S ribosomal protein S20 n=1 Tax=Lentibacillus sp. JNUCC-1 TaxID=2654513 RepID=UPI0012E8866A|nr:30S ribosomal protein S20 [Lentibacillus sp. JNUCC-1]MUV39577.1 30S ribosomal protein S20 [Lentibacillus sp. JNUCC-1]